MRLFVAFYFNFALDILRANVNIYRNKGKLASSSTRNEV